MLGLRFIPHVKLLMGGASQHRTMVTGGTLGLGGGARPVGFMAQVLRLPTRPVYPALKRMKRGYALPFIGNTVGGHFCVFGNWLPIVTQSTLGQSYLWTHNNAVPFRNHWLFTNHTHTYAKRMGTIS